MTPFPWTDLLIVIGVTDPAQRRVRHVASWPSSRRVPRGFKVPLPEQWFEAQGPNLALAAGGGPGQVPLHRPDRHHAGRHRRGCLFGRQPRRSGGRAPRAISASLATMRPTQAGFAPGDRADDLFQPRGGRTRAKAGRAARRGPDRDHHGAADGDPRPGGRAAGMAARYLLRCMFDPPARRAALRAKVEQLPPRSSTCSLPRPRGLGRDRTRNSTRCWPVSCASPSDRCAKLMTPRTEVDWIDVNAPTRKEVRRAIAEQKARIRCWPVADGTPDKILGLVWSRCARCLQGSSQDKRSISNR